MLCIKTSAVKKVCCLYFLFSFVSRLATACASVLHRICARRICIIDPGLQLGYKVIRGHIRGRKLANDCGKEQYSTFYLPLCACLPPADLFCAKSCSYTNTLYFEYCIMGSHSNQHCSSNWKKTMTSCVSHCFYTVLLNNYSISNTSVFIGSHHSHYINSHVPLPFSSG